MKHFLKSLFTLSLFCMALSVSSCGDDEETDNLNHAAQIAGEYVGTIETTYFGETIEKSKGSKLILQRSSNDFVTASFYYADGTQVFSNTQAYEITKTSGGTYVLRCKESTIEEIRVEGKKVETIDATINYVIDGVRYECDFLFEGTKQ